MTIVDLPSLLHRWLQSLKLLGQQSQQLPAVLLVVNLEPQVLMWCLFDMTNHSVWIRNLNQTLDRNLMRLQYSQRL